MHVLHCQHSSGAGTILYLIHILLSQQNNRQVIATWKPNFNPPGDIICKNHLFVSIFWNSTCIWMKIGAKAAEVSAPWQSKYAISKPWKAILFKSLSAFSRGLVERSACSKKSVWLIYRRTNPAVGRDSSLVPSLLLLFVQLSFRFVVCLSVRQLCM